MAKEIERKYLVKSDAYKSVANKSNRITQGYLSSVPQRTVRIRIKGEKGYITVKGIGNTTGASRYEWEKEIPVREAEELLALCEPGIIDKIRYEIIAGHHTLEVDEFFGENKGLVLAEIELSGEHEEIVKPEWLGAEVTGETRYYNSMLMKSPFTTWNTKANHE